MSNIFRKKTKANSEAIEYYVVDRLLDLNGNNKLEQ